MIRTGAITDEFSPDLETALRAMRELGMQGAELRTLSGKNIIDLNDDEVAHAARLVAKYGMTAVAIASPLLKCTLPDAPPVDERFQQDMFAAKYAYEDQPRLTLRAFEIAARLNARIIRVFSYWRVVQPELVFDRAVAALQQLGEQAGEHGIVIGLENEHACNIATAAESARALAAVSSPHVQLVWDPANAYVSGETPFPEGYGKLPPQRIAHVHAKDCTMEGHQPIWGPLGECDVDWRGQIQALRQDSYSGYIHLETHWRGPDGDKFQASQICGRNLAEMLK